MGGVAPGRQPARLGGGAGDGGLAGVELVQLGGGQRADRDAVAPEAFRAVTYRAVRPEDYAEAAERLPWVQRAGATFRWTGSWLTAVSGRQSTLISPVHDAKNFFIILTSCMP